MSINNIMLTNSENRFVSGIVFEDPAEIYTINVWVCKALDGMAWERFRYFLSRRDGQWVIQFEQPGNWRYIKLEIHHREALLEPKAIFVFVHPIEEPEIRRQLAAKKIVFLGCARQCGAKLPATLQKLKQLGQLFGEYEIGIFENDSTDDTRQILQEHVDKLPLKLILRDGLADDLPLRTARLAYARNALAEYAGETGADYICCADLDGLLNADYPDESAFLSSFKYESCWDAVFPVNAGIYYDIWALRHPMLCPGDYQSRAAAFDACLGKQLAIYFAASHLQLDFRRLLPNWLEVDSAFGGMGIYKKQAFALGRYYGLDGEREVCEHVAFNLALRARGCTLYLNPEFVIVG